MFFEAEPVKRQTKLTSLLLTEGSVARQQSFFRNTGQGNLV